MTAYACGFLFWYTVHASSAVVYVAPVIPDVRETILIATTSAELPHEIVRASISAYTSSVEETDDTPDINAMGTKPKQGSIACPTRYKFGTEVFIKEKKYICDDRMSTRYAGGDFFDIWFESRADAIHFGRQTIEVKVLQ